MKNLKPATLLSIDTVVSKFETSGAPAIWLGTHLALLGSQIGTGNAAHIVGAAVGALAGTGAGYATEQSRSKRRSIILHVQLDDGQKAIITVPKLKHPMSSGDRVWVKCDQAGIPISMVE